MKYTTTIKYNCYKIDALDFKISDYQTCFNVDICLSSNVLGMCQDFLSSDVVNNFISIFYNTAIYDDTNYIDFVNTNYVKNIRFPFKITTGKLHIDSVKVYKSNAISSEACYEDLKNTKLIDYYLDQVILSEGVISRCFNDHNLYYKLSNCNYDKNEKVFTIKKDSVYEYIL